MKYTTIRNNPKQFLALTSLTTEEFDGLLPIFSSHWSSWIRHFTLSGKPRQRRYSPKSDKLKLSDEEMLFLILYYHKNNPLQEAIAASFDMTQDLANKLIHILMPLLNKSLAQWKPETNPQRLDNALAEGEYYAGDCTERRVQRDKHDQEHYYSGKKKAHSVKNFLIVSAIGMVVFLSHMVEGKRHDKKMAEELQLAIRRKITMGLDSGFRGLATPECVEVEMPIRKPRNGELTDDQKAKNRDMSSRRVIVENGISGCKRLRIVKDVIRLHGDEVKELVFLTAVSVHNYRVFNRKSLCS
jgi:hypothetical protein